ncbi:hypothetical protein, partial [Pseudoalteromonas sp. GAB2316C]|uniref:hypothetical protein n=1 Tax=Pseudoalteromonas sp. GAB2316C TaxID=3025326 RepID=UPI00235A22AA
MASTVALERCCLGLRAISVSELNPNKHSIYCYTEQCHSKALSMQQHPKALDCGQLCCRTELTLNRLEISYRDNRRASWLLSTWTKCWQK